MNITIIDKDGHQSSYDQNRLIEILSKTADQLQENNFQAEIILDKAKKYLNIFLTGNEKAISEIQLFELLANICREEGFNKISSQLNPQSQSKNIALSSSPSKINLSKANQEKFKKIYLPASHNSLDIKILIDKIASYNSDIPTAEKISELISNNRFFPHQNIIKGAAAFHKMQIILEDNLGNIFDQLKQAAVNFQNLISTTINFSLLRQKMAVVKSTQGFSSGPVSFIKIYASTFEALRQNLSSDFTPPQAFVLNIHHPDILEYLIFIKNFQKNSLNKHLQFLIEITPAFLEALFKDEDFDLISPENNQTVNLLSAKNTFDLIVSTILENPQLGLIKASTEKETSIIISAIINLGAYSLEKNYQQEIINDLKVIQQYLKNQQEVLRKKTTARSKITLNFCGWNDLLIGQQIVYNSVSAIELAEELFGKIRQAVDQEISLEVDLNSPLLAIIETSRGLEALDQLATLKTNLDGQEIHQLQPQLRQYLSDLGLSSNETIKSIYDSNSLNDLYQIPVNIKNLFKTSREIAPQFHLELQRNLEKTLGRNIEKKVFFENSLDQERIKKNMLEELQLGINSIRFVQFDPINRGQENNDNDSSRNFLHNLDKNKKRRHREIQPPLFQIKKTEEITPPPIST